MLLFTKKIMGLLVDLDSFESDEGAKKVWAELLKANYKVMFLGTNRKEIGVDDEFEGAYFKDVEPFWTSDNDFFNSCLEMLELSPSEVVILTAQWSTVQDAYEYPISRILINKYLADYGNCGKLPDAEMASLEQFKNLLLMQKEFGYSGELYSCGKTGKEMFVQGCFSNKNLPIGLYSSGRYFPTNSVKSNSQPLTKLILKNKNDSDNTFDRIFPIYSKMVGFLVKYFKEISSIVGVPPKPGKSDRFRKIVYAISAEFKLKNLAANFSCNKNYEHKSSSHESRESNVESVFDYSGVINGSCILIDDVITTGATSIECAKQLIEAGADKVYICVLGINQFSEKWQEYAPLRCQACGQEMLVRLRGSDNNPFWACSGFPDCRNTLKFDLGKNEFVDLQVIGKSDDPEDDNFF